jgi:RHS repeat-associated protein
MQREGYGAFGATANPVTVNVLAPPPLVNNAQVVSTTVPARMVTGIGYDVAVTMKNTGTTTWTPGTYKLGQRDWDHEWLWGVQSVALPVSVAPGQQYTFQFKVWGPSPGSYSLQWAMVYVGGNEWFGAITGSPVTVTENLGNVTYIHTDGLGSPVARTDAAGTVLSRTRYEPYGYVASGAAPTIGFTGHVNDADTGLTYMQQRYYDPVAGRFLSIDPVTTDANTGESFNRYAYANNSPYKYVDPDGRFGVLGAFVGAGIEIGLQLAMQGKVDNWTAVGVAGAAGMVTGGLGGVIGKAAVSGTVTTSRAVTAAAAVGGAAGAASKVAEASLTGKSTSSKEVAVAAGLGAVGGGAGAKIGLSAVAAVERLVGRSGVAGHIGTTTQGAIQQGGRIVEPATTAGQTAAQNATDISTSYVEKKVN